MTNLNLDDIITTCITNNDTGFCTECGNEQSGVEPDARKRECESCGEEKVYGAEELLIMNGRRPL
tara:strand:+ start:5350 stop:5544 length:195 start_codon:yes stop_codon:yes gene_type:complete